MLYALLGLLFCVVSIGAFIALYGAAAMAGRRRGK